MFKCELFSIQKNKADARAYANDAAEITSALEVDGVELQHTTECAADAKKLSKALTEKLSSSESDLFLFVNALDSTDNSSFRKLFYKTIEELEAGIPRDEAHKELTPKLKVSSIGDLGNGYKGYCFSYSGKRFIALPCASLTGAALKDVIRGGIAGADDVFTKNAALYPVGIAFFDASGNEVDAELNQIDLSDSAASPKKKQGFIQSFIPQKGDTKKQKIRKIVVLIAIAAFIAALIYVLEFYIFGPMRNNAVTSEIQTIAHNKDNGDGNGDRSRRSTTRSSAGSPSPTPRSIIPSCITRATTAIINITSSAPIKRKAPNTAASSSTTALPRAKNRATSSCTVTICSTAVCSPDFSDTRRRVI